MFYAAGNVRGCTGGGTRVRCARIFCYNSGGARVPYGCGEKGVFAVFAVCDQ